MKNLIHIDLVPNFEKDDIQIINNLLNFNEENLLIAEKNTYQILKNYFPNGEIYLFNSARSALSFLLMNLNERESSLAKLRFADGFGKARDSEDRFVITQTFSCLVVPNAIKFAGFKPVYVDIDQSFNLDIEDLRRKINKKTKAIIIQNTFGLPAKIDDILNIAKEKNILVIENLTHALGAKYKDIYLGNFGDFVLLSFNRNKVISSIIGGALIVNNKNFNEIIKKNYELLPELDQKTIRKIIFTGKVLYKAKENYNFLMKIYLKILRKFGISAEMVSMIEKQGKPPANYLIKFPKVLFPLLENQLKKLEKFNQQRKEIAKIYLNAGLKNFEINKNSEPIFLRFPVITDKNVNEILKKFKKENIYLGDWYNCVLAPCSNLKNFYYDNGSCPQAEKIAQKIFNLPTLIKKEEAERIISKL
jgi:dTDP-4-amino-4,6-dideoxygalactose transaminase